MPQIVVMTEEPGDAPSTVLMKERVAPSDLESDHFAAQLVERVGWALLDADEVEHRPRAKDEPGGFSPATGAR